MGERVWLKLSGIFQNEMNDEWIVYPLNVLSIFRRVLLLMNCCCCLIDIHIHVLSISPDSWLYLWLLCDTVLDRYLGITWYDKYFDGSVIWLSSTGQHDLPIWCYVNLIWPHIFLFNEKGKRGDWVIIILIKRGMYCYQQFEWSM